MTPQQKIRWAILLMVAEWQKRTLTLEPLTGESIDDQYDSLCANSPDCLSDAKEEIRVGEFETHLRCKASRNYETKGVAACMPDGTWVGWTYYFGGGKHGAPENIEWIADAVDLDCKEEEKVVIVRTFTPRA